MDNFKSAALSAIIKTDQEKKGTPAELAKFVTQTLNHSKNIYFPPPESVIAELLEKLYFTSMQSEEGDMIRVNVTFIDHHAPKADKRIADPLDKWQFTAFLEPVPFEIKQIAKLAKAADPWSSSLAVYYDANENLWINGMIDQAIHTQSFLNHEIDSKPEQAGIFQVHITGIGILSVIFDYQLIAILRQNVIVNRFLDVLKYGQVSRVLLEDTDPLKKKLAGYIRKNFNNTSIREWTSQIENTWRDTISRLLIQIRNYHHGGAILITDGTEGLQIKYQLPYARLNTAIRHYMEWSMASAMYNKDFLAYPDEPIDQQDFFDSEHVKYETKTATNELKGAIRFVASQSCVDGLVLLNHQLEAIGFGAVIKVTALPDFVYQSDTNEVKADKLIPKNPDTSGTRHRSMMAFCWSDPGALGFVVFSGRGHPGVYASGRSTGDVGKYQNAEIREKQKYPQAR